MTAEQYFSMPHSMKKVTTLILALIFLGCSEHGHSEADFPSRSVMVNGIAYGYRVYVPANRDPNIKIPVMLYLHGSNRRGDDNGAQLEDIASVVNANRQRFSFIIVLPQCRGGKFWAGEMNEQAFAALDQTIKEFNGDENRLYLAGFSMGGNGTWQIGLAHPGKFAALIPVAANVAPSSRLSPETLESLPPRLRAAAVSPDPYKVFAEGIGSTPVWAFHGSDDEAVPVTESRKIVEAFKNAGSQNAKYSEFEGVGHGSVKPALSDPKLFEWLEHQKL